MLLLATVHSAVQNELCGCVLCVDRAFEDVFVSWRATFSLTVPALLSEGVNLTQELQHSSGSVLCRKGQVLCLLQLEVRPDQVQRQKDAVGETNTICLIICRPLSLVYIFSDAS